MIVRHFSFSFLSGLVSFDDPMKSIVFLPRRKTTTIDQFEIQPRSLILSHSKTNQSLRVRHNRKSLDCYREKNKIFNNSLFRLHNGMSCSFDLCLLTSIKIKKRMTTEWWKDFSIILLQWMKSRENCFDYITIENYREHFVVLYTCRSEENAFSLLFIEEKNEKKEKEHVARARSSCNVLFT